MKPFWNAGEFDLPETNVAELIPIKVKHTQSSQSRHLICDWRIFLFLLLNHTNSASICLSHPNFISFRQTVKFVSIDCTTSWHADWSLKAILCACATTETQQFFCINVTSITSNCVINRFKQIYKPIIRIRFLVKYFPVDSNLQNPLSSCENKNIRSFPSVIFTIIVFQLENKLTTGFYFPIFIAIVRQLIPVEERAQICPLS